MKKYQRILIEVFAPCLLGAFFMSLAYCDFSRPFVLTDFILGVGAWAFLTFWTGGFIPSVVYALAMELWFWLGLRTRFGLLLTVIFSALLGVVAGAWMEERIGVKQPFIPIGCLVGLLIGFIVSRRKPQPPDKSPEPTAVTPSVPHSRSAVSGRRWLSFLR
jgi:hypothetical protein